VPIVVCKVDNSLCLYQITFGIDYGFEDPRKLFKGDIPDHHFDLILEDLFGSTTHLDKYHLIGIESKAWIANSWSHFSIAILSQGQIIEIKNFTFKQKRKFFKRLKKYQSNINRLNIAISMEEPPKPIDPQVPVVK